jgi:hypothetical protein
MARPNKPGDGHLPAGPFRIRVRKGIERRPGEEVAAAFGVFDPTHRTD